MTEKKDTMANDGFQNLEKGFQGTPNPQGGHQPSRSQDVPKGPPPDQGSSGKPGSKD